MQSARSVTSYRATIDAQAAMRSQFIPLFLPNASQWQAALARVCFGARRKLAYQRTLQNNAAQTYEWTKMVRTFQLKGPKRSKGVPKRPKSARNSGSIWTFVHLICGTVPRVERSRRSTGEQKRPRTFHYGLGLRRCSDENQPRSWCRR